MAKPEWGLKRICHGCGARFYDMKRDPIHCPKCDAKFDPNAVTRPRRSRAAAVAAADAAKKVEAEAEAEAEAKAKAKAKAATEDEAELGSELDVEVEDDEEDSLIGDTSDLDEDNDVSGVIGGVESEKPSDG